jgi:hypothetical protein
MNVKGGVKKWGGKKVGVKKESPDVETSGLRYLDLISVVS